MQESNLPCESQSLVSCRLTNGLYKGGAGYYIATGGAMEEILCKAETGICEMEDSFMFRWWWNPVSNLLAFWNGLLFLICCHYYSTKRTESQYLLVNFLVLFWKNSHFFEFHQHWWRLFSSQRGCDNFWSSFLEPFELKLFQKIPNRSWLCRFIKKTLWNNFNCTESGSRHQRACHSCFRAELYKL